VRAVIFDFDGLILDTETTDYESWRCVYQSHGVTLPLEEWVEAIGTDGKAFDPVARLVELSGRDLEASDLRAARRAVRDALIEELTPLPGVLTWLEEARSRSLAVAIASSSPRDWVESHLERSGLRGHFSTLATSDQVTSVKPHPELYERALLALGVDASQAIAVEDSPHGVSAARAAGLRCLAVPGPMTRGLDFAHADLVLGSLA
jgi:HAD superfamily hydrolase (TIGR01509 family)